MTLSPPPPQDMIQNGVLSDGWRRWFLMFYPTLSSVIKTYGSNANVSITTVLHNTQLTTTERDELQNLQNGATIFNTTTLESQTYYNGSWY